MSPCLSDFTTTGLHTAGAVSPSGPPGVQIDGYPDTSTTNTLHGRNDDAQFPIRMTERWNGRLVVAGAPGVRKQCSRDLMVSDRVLARGFADASIDKGDTGVAGVERGVEPPANGPSSASPEPP